MAQRTDELILQASTKLRTRAKSLRAFSRSFCNLGSRCRAASCPDVSTTQILKACLLELWSSAVVDGIENGAFLQPWLRRVSEEAARAPAIEIGQALEMQPDDCGKTTHI